MQDGRRTEHRMTGEVELLFGGEDASFGSVVLDVEQEDRLELPQLLGDPEHQLRRERAVGQHDGQPVAGQGSVGEDVDVVKGERPEGRA